MAAVVPQASDQLSSPITHRATLHDLPYDLIRVLCTLMSGTDIVHTLMTCKTLYPLMLDEAIWQELCKAYGVEDTTAFGGGSFFRVYSGILHTYGPLLGLWASDRPFTGSIIEFRVDDNHGGIVGETWQFPDSFGGVRPITPYYCVFLIIMLPHESPANASGSRYQEPMLDWQGVPDPEGEPTLQVLSESDQSVYLRRGDTYWQHPDFPDPAKAHWLDTSRGRPRLEVKQSPTADPASHEQSVIIARRETLRARPFLYCAQGGAAKPSALCIQPHHRDHRNHEYIEQQFPHINFYDFRNLFTTPSPLQDWTQIERIDRFFNRYYPLRSDVRVGQFPAVNTWSADSLEGLWLGSYGPHGIEVLSLAYDAPNRVVNAWKITGDENVPRGAVSWTINLGERVTLDDLAPNHVFRQSRPPMMYRGLGTTCDAGFWDQRIQMVHIVVAITSEDDIVINWAELAPFYVPQYKRYKPRDYDSEIHVSELSRHASHDYQYLSWEEED